MTSEYLLLGLTAVLGLGIGSQWLAWRFRLPSILLLLVCGFLAGPITGLLRPEALFGDLLLPLVSLSVSIILFEGGLSLKLRELREIGSTVRGLIAIGVLVTWALTTTAAILVVGLEYELALLLGAILVVTGPTVVMPLVRYLRPAGSLGPILKWEGILNDVVGATLAVLVFESLIEERSASSTADAVLGIVKTLIGGGGAGLLGALVLAFLMRRYWIPDHLQSPMALMTAVIAFAAANQVQHESGLLATTIMGIVLANQRKASIKHIIEFKENLRVLLISSLFILLAARLDFAVLEQIGPESIAFVLVLILVVRPAAVFASTIRSPLSFREKAFLAWMAPRGIVAAAVSSVFALSLAERGYENAERLVSLTFLTIVTTIAVYGLTGPLVARWLKVSDTNPAGLLLIGAHDWARTIATALKERGFRVLLIDRNWSNVRAARMAGLPAEQGNALSEDILDELELGGIGRLLALTSNDEANSLVALHFLEVFGRENLYQLPPHGTREERGDDETPSHLRGRSLFARGADFDLLDGRFKRGAVIKATLLTEEFDYEAFLNLYSGSATPLFVVTEDSELRILTAADPVTPSVGQRVIAIVDGDR